MISDLSDTPWLDISKRIEDNIGKDQRRPFAFYNNAEQTIEFHLGTKIEIEGSNPPDYTTNGVNNIVLIYDLHNQSFLVDDNKSFNCADFAYISWEDAEVYAGSAINNRLYHMVERYYDTDGTPSLITTTPIKSEYDTPNICLGNPSDLKFFRWINFSGMMNKFTRFDITVYIDGKQEFHKIITWEDIANSERLALNVGWPDKDQMKEMNLMPFDYVADQWKIRKKGKRIRLQIIANTVGNNFCLNNLAFNAEAIGKFELNDKF
jgi:hypothetical protein